MWESVHGGEAGKGLERGAAPGKGLQEELLVGAEVGHSHLVVEQLMGGKKKIIMDWVGKNQKKKSWIGSGKAGSGSAEASLWVVSIKKWG